VASVDGSDGEDGVGDGDADDVIGRHPGTGDAVVVGLDADERGVGVAAGLGSPEV